jgi:hypothetical protein
LEVQIFSRRDVEYFESILNEEIKSLPRSENRSLSLISASAIPTLQKRFRISKALNEHGSLFQNPFDFQHIHIRSPYFTV